MKIIVEFDWVPRRSKPLGCFPPPKSYRILTAPPPPHTHTHFSHPSYTPAFVESDLSKLLPIYKCSLTVPDDKFLRFAVIYWTFCIMSQN